MKTACILKAHVESDGTVKVDERAPLPPGPAKVTVRVGQMRESHKTPKFVRAHMDNKRWETIFRKIDAVKCPPPPEDGLSIDELLYGAQNGYNDVY